MILMGGGLRTGHVDALGVPSVSNMDFTRANSLPKAPAWNNVQLSFFSSLFVYGC